MSLTTLRIKYLTIVATSLTLAITALWLHLGPKVVSLAKAEYYRFGDQVLMVSERETRVFNIR